MDRSQAMREVKAAAQKLVGSNLPSLARGEANRIMAVSDKGVTVRTKKSMQDVSWDLIDSVVDELLAKRRVTGQGLRDNRIRGGYRSAFILALLAQTSFATAVREGRSIRLELT